MMTTYFNGYVFASAFVLTLHLIIVVTAQSDGELWSNNGNNQYGGSSSLSRVDTSSETIQKILIDLYSRTDGLQWNGALNWLQQNIDVCDWKGVYCYDDSLYPSRKGQIQQIDLSHNNLVGSLPGNIFDLPYLESLNVEGNPDLSIDLSTALSDAEFLRFLTLSQTHSIKLDGIEQARNLEVLHIADANLDGRIPSSVFEIHSLKVLHANGNSFSGSLPPAIGQLTNMEELTINDNELTGQLPSELGRLSLMQILTLTNNRFGGTLPVQALEMMSNLRTLAIQRYPTNGNLDAVKGPGISGSIPGFRTHRRLTKLQLENQSLTGSLDPDFLLASPTGEPIEVDLRGNDLTGEIPSTLLSKRYLGLYLAGNQITNVPNQIYDRFGNSCFGISDWMNGDITTLGCQALLCPPGTWAPQGRATSAYSCQSCLDDSIYWGRTSCESSLPSTERERQILVKFYNALDGRNWKIDDNWLELDQDVCEWHGIGCDVSTKQIVSISLRNNGLMGMVPSDLFDLPRLKILSLESNQVEIDFNSVGNAKNLESLDLTATGARFVNSLHNLAGLQNFKFLSLASNALKGPIPDALFRLTSLEDIDLSYNDFTGSLSPQLGDLTNLKRFSCDGTELTGQLPSGIGKLTKLEEFSAGENKFSGSLPPALNSLTNLRSLALQQVTSNGAGIGGPLLPFTNLEQLTSLRLDSNSLTGTLPSTFLMNSRHLETEIEVGLSENSIEGVIPDGWSRFEQLILDLTGNNISGISRSVCQKQNWMQGAVERFQCDAILCPVGTYNKIGYRTIESGCLPCPSSIKFGTTHCDEKGTADVSSEFNILLEIYNEAGGDEWANQEGWKSSSNYCDSFHGIDCDVTGHVSRIDLSNNDLKGDIPPSVFQLKYLRELRLSGNSIYLPFESIGDAENLVNLYLDDTKINSVNGIGAASNLQILSLADNNLEGKIPQDLHRLKSLKKLNLGHNYLTGQLKDVFETFKSLESLHLYHNQFTGRIPAMIGELINLEELNLAENNFEGTIPAEINNLTNLRFLSLQREGGIVGTMDVGVYQGRSSLDGVGLNGPLPTFDKLSFLTELYLGVNGFTGSIPYNFLGGVTDKSSEIKVDLTSNSLTGTLPASLTEFDKLSIYTGGNRLTGIAGALCNKPEWLGGDVSSFKCDGILCPVGTFNSIGRKSDSTPTCEACESGTNGYLGSFSCLTSSEMKENSEREILEILYNSMDGPNWIENTNWLDPDITVCDWKGIQCDPAVDRPGSVSSIDLSFNRLSNEFPSQIYDLPNLKELNLQGNAITFTFNGIRNAVNLESLDLEDTGLTSLFGVDLARNLKLLRVDRNHLTSFPMEVFNLPDLQVLSLSNNDFSQQPIPSDLKGLRSLTYFACSGCEFTGPIPNWLGTMQNLQYLKLSQNALTGVLPSNLEQIAALKHLDLSDQATFGRGLKGAILAFSNQTSLTELYLQHNNFGGPIPDSFLAGVNSHQVVTVDIRYNRITGSIPAQLGDIDRLNLYLASNDIQGIPASLCRKNWNDGDVSENGCDGLLCPAGTFNSFGRKTAGVDCFQCDEPLTTTGLGHTFCGSAVEHESLKILYRMLGGPNWRSANNWLQTEDHCSWEGITCWNNGDFEGLVQRIELPDNNLVGELTFALIWQLEGLTHVDLQKNDVSIPFFMIGNAINLHTINLSYTATRSLIGIGEAKSLKELHMTSTSLTGNLPEELFSLTNLESLFLSNNGFFGPISTEFGRLKQLENLYLLGNKLTGTIPSELGYLARLQHLSIGKNNLSGTIPRQITSLPLLEFLALENGAGRKNNSISSGGGLSGSLQPLDGLPAIRELYLQHNSLTGTIPGHFLQGVHDKSAKTTVDLGFNHIVGSIPPELSNFQELNIFLVGNEISNIPSEICSSLRWMEGEVGNSCDSILCPPGTYNSDGRQVHPAIPCEACSYAGSARNYGATTCGPDSSDPLDDRAILFDLYDAAGGNSWTVSTGWKSDKVPHCDWYGVGCTVTVNGDLRVSELILPENNLNGMVPPKIFHLEALQKIDVSKNPVSISLQNVNEAQELLEIYIDETMVENLNGIGDAKKLEIFHAAKNSFGGQTIPEVLFEVSSLKDINLSDSMLVGTISESIGQLSHLERLTLSKNSFGGELPGHLGQLVALKELEISDNEWIGTIPPSWSGMSSLEVIALNNNDEKTAGVTGPLLPFSGMPNIRELRISNNLLTGTIPSNFFSGSVNKVDVVTIQLDRNHISGSIPSSLQNFLQLNLDLTGNLITGIGDNLCTQSDWNNGDVGVFGCAGILCPAGTFSSIGRQTSEDSSCQSCPGEETALYLGARGCASIDQQHEKEILTKLFQATNGPNWRKNDGWTDSGSDVCTWYGVECKEGSIVESIHLGSNNLAGTIPTDIFSLPNLKSLWLYSNPVEFTFIGIGEAKKLDSLMLASTKLQSLDGIGDALSLIELDISFNRLSGPIPNEITRLINLEAFMGSVNSFSGTIPDLSSLRKLSALRLSDNNLTGMLPSFSRLSSINALDLSDNKLVGSIPASFLQGTHSHEKIFVDLSDNLLTGDVPGSLSRVQDLTIYLRDNRISSIAPSLCRNTDWNQGDVGSFQCDGILCPTGTYAVTGRASATGALCQPCKQNRYYGSSTCGESMATSTSLFLSVTTLFASTTALLMLIC